MNEQDDQTGPGKKVGKNITTKRGTGNANRKKVKRDDFVEPTPPDPPKPPGLASRSLARDPVYGAEFACQFKVIPGSCKTTPGGIQCELAVTSPSGWWAKNIRKIFLPEYAGFTNYEQQGAKSLSLHRLVVPQFSAFFKAARVKKLAGLFVSNSGGHNSRTTTGYSTADKPSNHAYGTAIDINSRGNGIGHVPALRGTPGSVRPLADFCADFGIFWGGWYGERRDGMHFECVEIQTEEELRAACKKHGFTLEDVGLAEEFQFKKKA